MGFRAPPSVVLRRPPNAAGRVARTAVAAVFVAGLAAAAPEAAPKTTLVSVNSAGTAGDNRDANNPAINGDGRFVAFESDALDLVANDTNGTTDVFLRDLRKQKTTLVSVNSSGTASAGGRSSAASVSANGRFVAFTSAAGDLGTPPTGAATDVFVRDVRTGKTTLVSVNAAGKAGGNGQSVAPEISADGRWVAFASSATDLVQGLTTDGRLHVFVRDLKRRKTTLVSVNAGGTGGGNGGVPWEDTYYGKALSISANGRFVAFASTSTDLTAHSVTGLGDVFVRDLRKRTTTLVSVDAGGTAGSDGRSMDPSISADGRFVAFEGFGSDLVATPVGTNGQVYVRDTKQRTTTLASVDAAGTAGSAAGSYVASISANGRWVAFSSDGGDLVANDTNGRTDVFLRDLRLQTTLLVSQNSAGTNGGNQSSEYAAISGNGRFVAFYGYANDLEALDRNDDADVFVRDVR